MSEHSDVVDTWPPAAAPTRSPLIVRRSLEAWLDARRLGSGAVEAVPIGAGHSNVTYLVTRDGLRLVLRRPPRPPWPPSAHDVLREGRILRALEGRYDLAPRVVAVCEDAGVIGAPFYLMEEEDGHVPTVDLPAPLDTPAERRRIGEEAVSALARLHAVAWHDTPLADIGRPDGYLRRQLSRFGALWAQTGRELPAMARVGEWLEAELPPSSLATVVHGDFRLGNLMFGPSAPARLIAVLDWELCTLGDPLADLGYLCATWTEADDPPRPLDLSELTRRPGFPSRAELVGAYADAADSADVERLPWYVALALWKAAVLMENNHRRAAQGLSDDSFALAYGDVVDSLARRAAHAAGLDA